MILYDILNESFSIDATFFQLLLFMFIGAFAAVYCNAVGQAFVSKILKADKVDQTTSFNPLKQFSVFNLFGFLIYTIFGTSWIKPAQRQDAKIKNAVISVSGIVLCVVVAIISLFAYTHIEVIVLKSIFIAIATACLSYSFFNIWPLPGLNGGNILESILPPKAQKIFISWKKHSVFIIILAIALLSRSLVLFHVLENIRSGILSLFA